MLQTTVDEKNKKKQLKSRDNYFDFILDGHGIDENSEPIAPRRSFLYRSTGTKKGYVYVLEVFKKTELAYTTIYILPLLPKGLRYIIENVYSTGVFSC